MGDGNKNWVACCFSSSQSMKLLCFMIPVILISLFVSDLVPRNAGWVSISASPSATDRRTTETLHVEVEDGGGGPPPADPRSRGVLVVDVHGVSSAAPPAMAQTFRIQEEFQQNEPREENVTISPSSGSPDFTTLTNESVAEDFEPKKLRVPTSLERLESGLLQARAAIKEARNGDQLPDPDYVPTGPMYWDAKSFHRSYLEMEKHFKIFVYPEGEPPVFHDGPCKSIYSMEGNFIHKLDLDTKFRTNDPEKAQAFYLPFSVAKMVQFVYVRDSHDFSPIKRTVVDYIDLIGRKYPFWNRSLGADHFMLSCHDWGPEASFSLPYLHKNSIRALCNANTSEKFNPIKDVSIPEINLQTGQLKGLVGGPSPSRRPILGFFAGGVHGPIRPILLDHWENKDEDIRVHKYLPKGVSYYDMMQKSRFCICPSGYEVASPRIVEALYNGCVPVLISVTYVPPFSDVLNWKSFAVVLSVDDTPNLKNILTGISTSQYIRMQRRVLQVRRHFVFNSPPERFDVFHMILHSIWLRRLNVKINDIMES